MKRLCLYGGFEEAGERKPQYGCRVWLKTLALENTGSDSIEQEVRGMGCVQILVGL